MGVRVRLDGAVRKCAPCLSLGRAGLRVTAFGNVSTYVTSCEVSNSPHGFIWCKRIPVKRLTVVTVCCGRQLDCSLFSDFFFFFGK